VSGSVADGRRTSAVRAVMQLRVMEGVGNEAGWLVDEGPYLSSK
jgi:hypothetical protein